MSKLTNRQVLDLNRALELLEEQPDSEGTLQPSGYVFGDGAYAIARNLDKTSRIAKVLEKTRGKMLRPIIDELKKAAATSEEAKKIIGVSPGTPEYDKFMAEWLPILDAESDFEPYLFDREKLLLERDGVPFNKIPLSLIVALASVLKE